MLDFIYNKEIINFYLHILSENNIVGICSGRQTGKSTISYQVMVEYLIQNKNKDGIIFDKYEHIKRYLLRYLDEIGYSYVYKNNILIFDNGSTIYFKHAYVDDIRSIMDFILIENIEYQKKTHMLIEMVKAHNVKLLHNSSNDDYIYKYVNNNRNTMHDSIKENSYMIDNTKVDKMMLRKLKIKRFKNDK